MHGITVTAIRARGGIEPPTLSITNAALCQLSYFGQKDNGKVCHNPRGILPGLAVSSRSQVLFFENSRRSIIFDVPISGFSERRPKVLEFEIPQPQRFYDI